MKYSTIAAFLILASGCASTESCPCAAPGSGVVVTPVLRTDRNMLGQPLAMPSGDIEVVVSRCEIPPGARLPVHKHLYQRYAYVLSGRLRVAGDQLVPRDYATGSFLADPVDAWHYAENTGTEPAVLLLIDHVPKGQANMVKK